MQIANLATTALTMTSREIADLVGKQHSNIKISADRLSEKGVIGTLAVQEFTHNGNKSRLARALGILPSSVTRWGECPPLDRQDEIRTLYGVAD